MLDLDAGQDGTGLLPWLRRQNEGPVRPRSQGPQEVLFLFEPIDGALFQRAVDAHVGGGIDPGPCLMVEILIVDERTTVEEPFSHVPYRAFDLAFGLSSIRPAGSDPEAPMVGKAEELGVLEDAASLVPFIVDDHGLHLIEKQLGGHAAEVGKRVLQPLEEMLHGLTPEKLQPEDAGIAQHDEQGVPLAPGKAKVGKVDLPLSTRRRLEADDGFLRRLGTDRADILLHLRVTAPITGGLDLRKEPYGGKLGIGIEPSQNDGRKGIDLPGNRRSGPIAKGLRTEVSVQLTRLDPMVNGAAAHTELLGHRRLGLTMFEIVFEQNAPLPSDHRVSTRNEETPN